MNKEDFCNRWWNGLTEPQKQSYLIRFKIGISKIILDGWDSIWNELSSNQKHEILLKNYSAENTPNINKEV